jgi:hypothetical protein
MENGLKTVALKKADGIVKMVVLADEAGKPLRMSKSEATQMCLGHDNLKPARDNFSGTSLFDKKGRYLKTVYNFYFVRVR